MPKIQLPVLLFLLFAVPATGQDGKTFEDDERVTAVDVLVDLQPAKSKEQPDEWPPPLGADDFEVLVDGRPRPVVGLEAGLDAGEPWTFVVYFDLVLSNPVEVGWAASELMAQAERLTALGTVDVVVADPVPRRAAVPTRDLAILEGVLSEIALFPEGDEHEVLGLRDDLLTELEAPTTEMTADELVPLVAAYEQRLVRGQLDRLTTFLAGLSVGADADAGARRALFLVSGGFDLDPAAFYRRHTKAALPESSLDADAAALERTLAAYGWTTFAMLSPPEPPPMTGVRIGKWLVNPKPQGGFFEQKDPLNPANSKGTNVFGFSARREHQRDPDRADAYLDLGRSLRPTDAERAEHAYRLAIYHYAQDPRTADRQAAAWEELGEVLEGLGRRREARGAYQRAGKLDPGAARQMGPVAEMTDPLQPGLRLAQATTGAVLRHSSTLARVLQELHRRVRLTFQVSGLPDGELHRLEVRSKKRKVEARASAWTRSGVPSEVASARIRRLLADDAVDGDLDVRARLTQGGGRLRLETTVGTRARVDRDAPFRVTIGLGSEMSAEVDARVVEAPPFVEGEEADGQNGIRTWTFVTDLAPPSAADAVAVAVLVEDLTAGTWGSAVVDLPDLPDLPD